MARDIRTILQNGYHVTARCEGHADQRHTDEYNQGLSEKRCNSVSSFLKGIPENLGNFKGFDISSDPKGEKNATKDRRYYAKDRRVDIFIRVKFPRDLGAAQTAKRRASIFRKYSPVYNLWVQHGLDYLIDQYEVHGHSLHEETPVKIRTWDLDRALALVGKLASPADCARIKRSAIGRVKAAVITMAYIIEYRRAYAEAIKRAGNRI